MQLRNRRLPSFVLTVEVMRVPTTLVPGYTEGAAPPSMPTSPGTHLLRRPRPNGVDDDDNDSPGDLATHPVRPSSNTDGYTTQQSPGDESGAPGSLDRVVEANGHGNHHPAGFVPVDNDTVQNVSRMVAGYEARIQEEEAASSHGGASLSGYGGRFHIPGHQHGTADQGNALRSMSGVLIKEWSTFVLKEVRARKEVEKEML